MSLTDGSGLSATDIMALTGNNDGFGGGFGGGWWVILFILLLFGGGFGYGRGNGGNDGGFASMAVPYMYNSGVQQGFDQNAVMTALGNLNTAIANGFASASVDSCNKAMANMQAINGVQMQMSNDKFDTINTLNNNHNNILTQMSNYEMARQQCCCDSKMATADLKASLLAEHCSDRADIASAMNDIENKMNAGFQGIKDQLFQNQLDAVKQENENLRMQAYMNNLAASQNAQTQALYANNQAQTDQIMSFLNPGYARPFFGWAQNQAQGCPCSK